MSSFRRYWRIEDYVMAFSVLLVSNDYVTMASVSSVLLAFPENSLRTLFLDEEFCVLFLQLTKLLLAQSQAHLKRQAIDNLERSLNYLDHSSPILPELLRETVQLDHSLGDSELQDRFDVITSRVFPS